MNLPEVLRQTFSTLRAHKLRSFLTMFGIVWGIASVILLVGLGKGFSADQQKRMESLGKALVIVWGGRTSAQAGGYAAGREIELTVRDAEAIRDQAYLVRNVSPELRRPVPQVSQYNSANRPVRGIWPAYQTFRSLLVAEGRLMTDEDESDARRVVILGHEARQQLFPGGNRAIGEQLTVRGVPYTVIGVLEKKRQNGSYGSGPDDTQLFVPYSAMARDFPPSQKGTFPGWINNLVFEVKDPMEHEAAEMQVRAILGRIHHFDPADRDALFIWNTMEGAQFVQKIFDVMTIFFGCIAVVTLLLGGIGVMNIMLVSVTERTNEIGVRMALGATKADISRQFFTEGMIITLASGIGGLLLGVGISLGMQAMPKAEFLAAPIISPVAILVSVFTLALITVTAGMYPARRAAEMTPVECLRAE